MFKLSAVFSPKCLSFTYSTKALVNNKLSIDITKKAIPPSNYNLLRPTNKFKMMRLQLMNPSVVYTSLTPDAKSNIKLKLVVLIDGNRRQEVHLERNLQEPLSQTISRLCLKLNETFGFGHLARRKFDRGFKVHDQNFDPAADVKVFSVENVEIKALDGSILPMESATNEEAFVLYGKTMMIRDLKFKIERNVPYFDKLNFSLRIFADCPVLPSARMMAGTTEKCRFDWFMENERDLAVYDEMLIINPLKYEDRFEVEKFHFVHCGPFYVPKSDDVGKRLLVIAYPKHEKSTGIPNVVISKCKVEKFIDEEVIWHERHILCAEKPKQNQLRVLTYNVLADLYLDLEKLPQEKLFFAHCPVEYQKYDYRYPLLLRELNGYNMDLACLQEVDVRFQIRYLEPYFKSKGFEILYSKKGRDVNEGALMMYNPQKLQHLDTADAILNELLGRSEFEDINRLSQSDEESHKIFSTRPAVLQVNFFKLINTPNQSILCVANTHLHFHPKHGHIRLQQIALCMRYLNLMIREMKEKHKTDEISVLFCGDLNSMPESVVLKCLLNGEIKSDNEDWFDKEKEEQTKQSGVDVITDFKLKSLCPASYTNYVGEKIFFGCLDYILAGNFEKEENVKKNGELKLVKSFPMPRHELVTKFQGLPSKIAPSDHLPLICDLEIV